MLAPAKINLSLEITGRKTNGYHELSSLVTFASIGDELTFTSTPQTADFGLEIDGPYANMLSATSDNLILKTCMLFTRHITPLLAGGHFRLTKNLPIASGIGGGSSDAAATLIHLAQYAKMPPTDPRLQELALKIGADVPICLARQTLSSHHAWWMSGIGEQISKPISLPPFSMALINPNIPVETRHIFKQLDLDKIPAPTPPLMGVASFEGLVAYLKNTRNDLEPIAIELCPQIKNVLSALQSSPHCALARMSGSGATCFGIFESDQKAREATLTLQKIHPNWWIKHAQLH